ncbi:SusC/RagA family TonB-linked outer membrane protein [Aquimarina sediminis]|uniref:SusC/RagA family TonB-linked outer membrane protein n=1 Tax=Aquimarina sediminis TaxID=2070536 RepID=UPI000CA05EEF|nr:SusC/RagA family TonB-linked outer membrane protein [Aquimarina sediminis]
MRYTFLLYIFFFFNLTFSQEEKITLTLTETSVVSIFDQIEEKTDYRFFYRKSQIQKIEKISINVIEESITKILEIILKNTPISYSIIGNQVILVKKEEVNTNAKTPITKKNDFVIIGNVKNDKGQPLSEVNIYVKSSTKGTVSDIKGNFLIQKVDPKSILIFSYLGYVTKEVPLNKRRSINVVLYEETTDIDEIVLVGYDTFRKKDVTGAISSLNMKHVSRESAISPQQLLQGRIAGVQGILDSGEPGTSITLRIRGTSSIRNGNGPLFVVNGIPLSSFAISPTGTNIGSSDDGQGNTTSRNPLNFIDPNDIESIDVLKDASATAIYGSRGANGVIIIKTKEGGKGMRLHYSSFVGISTITKKVNILSPKEFREFVDPSLDFGSSTDWQDVIFRTAFNNNHNISFEGNDKNEKTGYRLSLGIMDQEGIIEDSGIQKYSGTINTTHKILDDKLNIRISAIGANVLDQNPQISNDAGANGDLLSGAWISNPTRPIFNADGSFFQPNENDRNLAAVIEYTEDKTNTFNFLGNLSADLKLGKNFSYGFGFGLGRYNSERQSAISRDLNISRIQGLGRATISDVLSSNLLIDHTLKYTKTFAGQHRFSTVFGYSYQKLKLKTKRIEATNFQTSDINVMLNNLESVQTNIPGSIKIGSNKAIDEFQSFFGRVNYSFIDKYIFTTTLRADGSSRFGVNNKYGYFPSLGVAWRISEESFIPEVIDNLKLRLGFGITGNQDFEGGNQLRFQRFGSNNQLQNLRFENPDLKWETTTQFNVGIDYTLFKNRVRGSIDLYTKKTKDLLIRTESAEPAPAEFLFKNIDAEIVNKGIEFDIESTIIDKKEFKWMSAFNISINKNEVTKIDRVISTGAINGQGLTGAYTQVITQGRPLYSYFLSDFKGLDDNGFNVFNNGGEPVFVDKTPFPDYSFGWYNSVVYKKWNLNVFLSGQVGAHIYNNNTNAFFLKGALINGGRNVTHDVAFGNENSENSNNVSTRFLEDGSYLRFQNIELGYTFNTHNLKYVDYFKLSLTAKNLYTITNYSGQDPEVNIDKSIDGVPSLGIDYSAYPKERSFNFGFLVTFK